MRDGRYMDDEAIAEAGDREHGRWRYDAAKAEHAKEARTDPGPTASQKRAEVLRELAERNGEVK